MKNLQTSLRYRLTSRFFGRKSSHRCRGANQAMNSQFTPAVLSELRQIVGQRGLITAANQLQTYECDGLTAFRVPPAAVVLPESTEQVQKILRVCHRERIPFVARGSGTGLSGGALPTEGSIVISLS